MQSFYNKALTGLLVLMAASVLIGFICMRCTYIRMTVLPAADRALPMRSDLIADKDVGGRSTIRLVDDTVAVGLLV